MHYGFHSDVYNKDDNSNYCCNLVIALCIELSVLGRIEAVGVGTVASALLVGRSIKWFNRHWFTKSA